MSTDAQLRGACECCGRQVPVPTARTESGPIHFECWDHHHSDPTGPWPPEHVCARQR